MRLQTSAIPAVVGGQPLAARCASLKRSPKGLDPIGKLAAPKTRTRALVNALDRQQRGVHSPFDSCTCQTIRVWMNGRARNCQSRAPASREGQLMSSQFAARSVRLGQLFADPLQIEAPPYQRSYAWTSIEAGRLL